MITPVPEFWKVFKETPGAFSCAEALALRNICLQSPKGVWVELGSHKDKSSMVIASSLYPTSTLYLVEPEFKDENWLSSVVEKVSVHTPFIPIAAYSLDVLHEFKELAFCFVDSGVHDDMVMQECKLLEDKIIEGGVIAFHDYLNQFTAVERAYNYLLSTGKYEEIKINWQEIFDYVAEHDLENGNVSWHLYENLGHPPNFIGAVRKK